MEYTIEDIKIFLKCPRRFFLDKETEPEAKDLLFNYLKKCITFMYSEELCNKYKVHFRRVIGHWDRVFWATREDNDETAKLSLKGLEYLKNFYDKVYIKDTCKIAVVDFEHKFNPFNDAHLGVDFKLKYDIISIDESERIHLSYFSDDISEYNSPSYDIAARIFYYILSDHLNKPIYAIHKINICTRRQATKAVFLTPGDIENIPRILQHVSAGIKNNVNAPVFGKECKGCPYYLCTY